MVAGRGKRRARPVRLQSEQNRAPPGQPSRRLRAVGGAAVQRSRRPTRTVQDVSAGGVVVRTGPDGLDVALVGRGKPLRWSLPKGGIEAGETIDMAAVREAQEETGLQVRLLAPVGDIQYWFATRTVRHHKTVHFFLMEAVGGNVADHDWENDEAAWFPIADALSIMAFPNEATMVRRAWEVWQSTNDLANA
jgi:8-oxo-dGTP pyrophosphatase MutT (NUDIX family)